ncbi:MAG: ABC transporter ATP-binding protein [Chloroflexi bacterium]|nr:ABC transporter ATP-binding protein [Chloroflexota bacterium]MBV9547911.1 ABC transporter ATP-binding protein [Chloroflexota bacterium]
MHHVWRLYRVGDEDVVALRDATVCIRAGELVAVVGPSGSGKSTFLQLIGLLDSPSSGEVRFNGRNVGSLGEAERTHVRLESLGFVFQRFHLLNQLTAIENVMLPMEAAGLGAEERYARAAQLLESVGLGDRLVFRPAQLSGGQRQRVAVARAVANSPSVILADEPTGELHTDDKARVLGLFNRLNEEGRTIVIVTHDPDVAAVARRQVEIRDGTLRG